MNSAWIRSNAHVSRESTQAPSSLPSDERAEAERIAHADDLALAHHHQRKGALDASAARPSTPLVAVRLREQVQDDLAVHRGLENRAALLQFVAQHRGVDQIAIVADRDLPAAQC